MAEAKKAAGARITSQGWELGKGEHATISAPRATNCDGIVGLFRKIVEKSGKRNGLPRELKEKAAISFSQTSSRLFIRINVHSQDTRSEKFVDSAAKRILRLCRE